MGEARHIVSFDPQAIDPVLPTDDGDHVDVMAPSGQSTGSGEGCAHPAAHRACISDKEAKLHTFETTRPEGPPGFSPEFQVPLQAEKSSVHDRRGGVERLRRGAPPGCGHRMILGTARPMDLSEGTITMTASTPVDLSGCRSPRGSTSPSSGRGARGATRALGPPGDHIRITPTHRHLRGSPPTRSSSHLRLLRQVKQARPAAYRR